MGRYGLRLREQLAIPAVLREHNFESQIYERFARTSSNPLKRWVATLHGRRLRKEETHFLRTFDAVAAISQEDARLIRDVAPMAKVEVIPAGVDTGFFAPTPLEDERPDSVLWVGGMAWDPNRDALDYFLTDIWPRIVSRRPQATLDIVGEGTESVQRKAEKWRSSVMIHGRVSDVRDYLRSSAVLVVPLRVGGGMRLKIVEFFAAGKAVVSTSIGAEGNVGRDNVELLIRDSSSDFAAAVVSLLEDPELRSALGSRARKLAVSEYGWSRVADQFGQLYTKVRSAVS
jgi:glycosyltransferase involved in cell wall biosynthesis